MPNSCNGCWWASSHSPRRSSAAWRATVPAWCCRWCWRRWSAWPMPVMALAMILNNGSRVAAFRRDIEWPHVRRVLALGLPACMAGAYGYTLLEARGVALLIGLFLLASIPLRRALQRARLTLGSRGEMGAGAVFGFINGGIFERPILRPSSSWPPRSPARMPKHRCASSCRRASGRASTRNCARRGRRSRRRSAAGPWSSKTWPAREGSRARPRWRRAPSRG